MGILLLALYWSDVVVLVEQPLHRVEATVGVAE
jgi:hypothetical protein